mgnify:CR=1 FL=1
MKELPRNIKRDDILQGIRKIEEEGIPPQAHSSTYDLLYNGKIVTKMPESDKNITLTAKFVKVTVGKAGSLSVRSKAGKGVGFVARSTQSVNKYGEKRGFRFRYSTSKKMKSAKYKTTGLAKNVYTKTGLKKGKKYYVQVRYYYYDSTNQKVYGAYSKAKSVKAY